MSAVFKTMEAEFEPLTEARLDEVVAIERAAYDHPWTRGNFAGFAALGLPGAGAVAPATYCWATSSP